MFIEKYIIVDQSTYNNPYLYIEDEVLLKIINVNIVNFTLTCKII